ncbi:Lon protease family protein [Pantoea sp. Mb-10]|uniref:AAA family ATPase n=1 Tax=unclassified Pantoea TaxID=2630326 RepID=UPI001E62F017|nr:MULTISPECIES: Lon protease family protein [unclassified Pantoea]MCE0488577.1 Lon protease family protein [Pantoea sp. Mb-10]MCE0500324.1 Lon protease family protein [Pantoea sp. Pb-8]
MQQRKTCCEHHSSRQNSAVINPANSCIIALFLNLTNANILTNTQITWQTLQPDSARYHSIFSSLSLEDSDSLAAVQPRLLNALAHLHHQTLGLPLLLLRSQENRDYLSCIAEAAERFQPDEPVLHGGDYLIMGDSVSLQPASNPARPFTSQGGVHFADWIEPEQLFGCVRQYKDRIQPEPGLIHRANGGTLILAVTPLLAQPLMWLRLRKCLELGRFDWYSQDERQPLPVAIPALPLTLRLVLCGERDALASFQEMDAEVHEMALYSEFEENLQINDEDDITNWCQWTLAQAEKAELTAPDADFWPLLINEAVRMTGDQETLPLCPRWLRRQLQEAALHGDSLNAVALKDALEAREWRESYLAERMRDEILLDQIMIETDGERVGQINGLSVVEFPGHPRPWGEPSRITCVVHPGDGEFNDVERKAELGGNIHAKGMMIMQAYLIAELELDQQLPFSASVVFEQSYSEVDGDSASLAELCALISALANQPLSQQIAVTGSVDQFGNVQPVGGLNEKIEGFFHICNARELTGKQGVILPASNVRHLSLSQEVVEAVKAEQFHLWAIESVEDALPLLTGMAWNSENGESLINLIQERITQFNQPEVRQRPWPLRWMNWFNHR